MSIRAQGPVPELSVQAVDPLPQFARDEVGRHDPPAPDRRRVDSAGVPDLVVARLAFRPVRENQVRVKERRIPRQAEEGQERCHGIVRGADEVFIPDPVTALAVAAFEFGQQLRVVGPVARERQRQVAGEEPTYCSKP
jgi:hypothetical protein